MNIYAFADEASPDIDGQIKAMKDNRLNGLEIRNTDGVNISDITEEKAYEVKEKLDNAGLTVWSVGSPIGKISIYEADKHIEKFRHTLCIAKILGAENIRIFSYYMPHEEDLSSYTDDVINHLSELVKIAEGTGITLCHENEKGIYGDTAERCLEIHKAIPQLKAIFDPANFVQCKVDTKKAWEMLKPYVKYLHIKDALADGRVVPAGKGTGNLKYILDDFIAMGKDSVTLEPHLTVFKGLSELEQENPENSVAKVYAYKSETEAFSAAAEALRELI